MSAELIALCGAKTADGGVCDRQPSAGSTRCASHGGAPGAGGPLAERNGRFIDGHHTNDAKARRSWVRRQLKMATKVETTDEARLPVAEGNHLAAEVRLVSANYRVADPPAGVDRIEWLADLRQALGGGSEAFVETSLVQLVDAAAINRDYTATPESLSAALEVIRGLEPVDTMQAALAVHVAQLHMAAAAMNGRIHLFGSNRRTNEEAIAAAKLERAFLAAVETFYRIKRGNRQIIRIERVIEIERRE